MSHRENIRWMLLVPILYVVPLLRQSRKLQPQWLTRSCGLLNSPCVDIPCSKQFYSKIQKITTKFQETRFIKKTLKRNTTKRFQSKYVETVHSIISSAAWGSMLANFYSSVNYIKFGSKIWVTLDSFTLVVGCSNCCSGMCCCRELDFFLFLLQHTAPVAGRSRFAASLNESLPG